MRCNRCNKDFPSKFHFDAHGVCKECVTGMDEDDRSQLQTITQETLVADNAQERLIDGNKRKTLHRGREGS